MRLNSARHWDSVDTKSAKASPGVVDVITIPTGVAVLATDYWSAKKGRDLLVASWDESKAFKKSSVQIMEEYTELSKKSGLPARIDGDEEFSGVDNNYEFPFWVYKTTKSMLNPS